MDRIREAITRARETRGATPAETQRKTDAPAIARRTPGHEFEAVSCDFDRFTERRIISNEQDPVLNAYRVLRTRVLQRMETHGWRTLAVISPGSGAGKTVTAINLAIAIGSKEDSQACLVDLDFYRPSVAKYLGITEFPSILDYFEGDISLEEATVRPDLNNMLLMANERVTRRGAEHLTSDKADALIQKAVHDYQSRVVVFDMSPLLGCDDTLAFLPKVDCVLLVAASGQTRVPELKEAKRILKDTHVIGTVLNKSPNIMLPNQYY